MLHETLEKASRNAKRNRLMVIAVVAGFVTVGGLAVFGTSMYVEIQDLRSRLAAKEEAKPASDSAVIVPPLQPKQKPEQTVPSELAAKSDLAPRNQGSVSIPPLTQSTPPINVARLPATTNTEPLVQPGVQPPTGMPATSSPESTEDTKIKRAAFKAELMKFETKFEPEVSSESYGNWAIETQKDIIFLKNAAIAAFSAGDFNKAIISIGKATELARRTLGEKRAAYAAARSNALQAYDDDNVERAESEIAKAIALGPISPELSNLQVRISALPKVLKHLKAADIARVENDLQLEHSQLQKALNLDPNRVELKSRLKALATTIRENTFSQHILSGDQHVRNRSLTAAQKSATAARRLFPRREEMTMLDSQIAALANDIKTQKSLGAARVAAVRDDWYAALEQYEAAKKLQPTNADAVNGAKLASTITELDAELSTHLQTPERLASSNVAAIAGSLISRAQAVKGESAALDTKSAELIRQRKIFSAKVPIVVRSDGISHIIVKGIGQVGSTKKKTIRLKPGEYTFESTRAGYRTKLVKVSIPPNGNPFTIEIFCDERI